jgi:hypothetical protein
MSLEESVSPGTLAPGLAPRLRILVVSPLAHDAGQLLMLPPALIAS